jgi:hypothetical protein
MKVEILYLSGCPNYPPAVRRTREVLQQEGVTEEVVEIAVNDAETAEAVGFLGSPTIRVDGQDVEIPARSARTFGFTCRTYLDGGHRTGVPPAEWIRAAVREATQKQQV